MITHFSIGISNEKTRDYKKVVEAMQEIASGDERIISLDREKLGHLFVFCPDTEITTEQKEKFEKEGVVSPSLGTVTLDGKDASISVNLECGDDCLPSVIPFVKAILEKFAPCRIFDEDSDRELTEEVEKDVDFLFK